MLFSWPKWLNRVLPRVQSRRRKKERRRDYRPQVERFEDRLAPAIYRVTGTGDDDGMVAPIVGMPDTFTATTLRAAIKAANDTKGVFDIIEFQIPGVGPHTIQVTQGKPLPTITDPVRINGYSQLGAKENTLRFPGNNAVLLIQLDGSKVGAGANGLTIVSGKSTVRGLVIRGFEGDGIRLEENLNFIEGNFIGTDVTGTEVVDPGKDGLLGTEDDRRLGNRNGVFMTDSSSNTIVGNVISGNKESGVHVEGILSKNNTVAANFIGTNRDGTTTTQVMDISLGNSGNGVTINRARENNILVNVISGNKGNGIAIIGGAAPVTVGSGNQVLGNFIGTDATGSRANDLFFGNPMGNGAAGVFIDGARANIIGTNKASLGNVISGNKEDGVRIRGDNARKNIVQGNSIGVDKEGENTFGLGNGGNGVSIEVGASQNTIGGTAAGAGNVISNNKKSGVLIIGVDAERNCVEGNFIGTNKTGDNRLGNGDHGVWILSSSRNTIGGDTARAGNVISGNGTSGLGHGIYISVIGKGAASENVVQRNLIGTDKAGTKVILFDINGIPLGNFGYGVFIEGASENTIGGEGDNLGNVISGNRQGGVRIAGNGAKENKVQGNFIGTDKDGQTTTGIDGKSLGNIGDGVSVVDASSNTIGGTAAGAGNVISGNGTGVRVTGKDNKVQGNFIGTNKTGNKGLGNGGNGVDVGGRENVIGGTEANAGNVISDNGGSGIQVGGDDIKVQGNFIGTDKEGKVKLGNEFDGVFISGGNKNTIGGTAAGAGNVISGNGKAAAVNKGHGVHLGIDSTKNFVLGNYIGTNKTGDANLGNQRNGVWIEAGEFSGAASENTIGGETKKARNVISGNGENGVKISGELATKNMVLGNFIGTKPNGRDALANQGSGVLIDGGASDNTIGGGSTTGNVIAFNKAKGVVITSGTGNRISGNSIFSNFPNQGDRGLGIDLADDGVTANDNGDGDGGPNRRQNFPELTSAVTDGLGITVKGKLNSTPGTYVLEFFANDVPDPSGHGEGKTFIRFKVVTIEAGQNEVEFDFLLEPSDPIPADQLKCITATATSELTNDTSEFSKCLDVQHQVFFDDFQNGGGGGIWSRPDRIEIPAGSGGFASGRYGNEAVYLTLTDLPAHSQVTISFDLFILQSWDGNSTFDDPVYGLLGPDRWRLQVIDGPTLLDTTFSNHAVGGGISETSEWQAYGGDLSGGSFPAFTGAVAVNTLGYFHPVLTDVPMDSTYSLSFTFDHTGGTIVFCFSASLFQDLGDESWALDNVRVTVSG